MDKPIYIFEPFKQDIDGWLVLTSIVLALAIFGILYFKNNKKMEYNRRNALLMVFSFVTIIATATGAFRLYSKWRLKPVEIYVNKIVTPYGTAPFKNIRDFYIKLERRYKPMQENEISDSAHYFFILERNDKGHVLSEGDYPIDSILAKLNDAMGYK